MPDRPTTRLRRVTDDQPGFTRRAAGRGFAYYRADGRPLRDATHLARIRSLAIPPAWTDTWICADAAGHIQATGRDARGRKQYRYHERWSRHRESRKYDRMLGFALRLPAIRRRVSAHLALRGLVRERVLAAVVRLLELTSIRVGNSEYARHNHSFGLTTLRRDHVRVRGDRIRLGFPGKGGRRHRIEVEDARVAAVVRECLALPGEVFKHVNGGGRACDVTAADVNAYLRTISGADVTAKDFRTWAATVRVVLRLLGEPARDSGRARKAALLAAIDEAAEHLGNTRAICRKSYVHPGVQAAFLARGTLGPVAGKQRRGEAVVISTIRRVGR